MKIFHNHVFEVSANTDRSQILDELKKFGIFSDVEFECKDKSKGIFFVREVGLLKRIERMFHGILSKDTYRKSGDALLDLSKKNLILAGVLGRSVHKARENPVAARGLSEKLRLDEKKLESKENGVFSVPSEGKVIVTDALLRDFERGDAVDLTAALSTEGFQKACNSEFSKAMKTLAGNVLMVKLSPVFDNDEPSDEAIKKLLLVIDQHQICHPDSRLMIVTDGDHDLYARVLDIKMRHEARKVARTDNPDFSAMDLFMISPHGERLVKLEPLDEKKLEKKPTQFSNVYLCTTDSPEMIQSDLSIIAADTLSYRYDYPEQKPSAASKLLFEVISLHETSDLKTQFDNEKKDESLRSTLHAARFPSLDLPVERLIVFDRLRASLDTTNDKYEELTEKAKKFFLEALRGQSNRVVIESPSRKYAIEGLKKAVEELRQSGQGPREIIITSKESINKVQEIFPELNRSAVKE